MSKYFICSINEQDHSTEIETDMYLKLSDDVTDVQKSKMFHDFLLSWYADGEWEDDEKTSVWFDDVGKSVSMDVIEIKSEDEWNVLVKHSYNSTAKFVQYLSE